MADQELEIRKLKRTLENWREIVLPLSSVLKWEKNWYPGAVLGGSTLLFLVLWLLDPSILTTFSLLGLTLTISDYLVPLLISSIYKPDSWTAKKEMEFEGICRSLVIYKTKLQFSLITYYKMRTDRPKLFYLCTIVTLISMAYIGNLFNNLFLTYIFITSTLLIPGMLHNGMLQKYGAIITQAFSGIADNLKNKVGHAKKE
ncbi:ADP-ribosylation factor-like protein 6-interacting protein 1 isoform X3 [Agrilus planipennis]|uniref:ADP-ribosylation factor-like protein 6-interacting protein 1 isoform X3 n=1 Tax=Agrilus planipennis TaxID=224129 RepID=A0A1W4XKC4_AGRPL|nr:ADP-ribosylation factor-like protein 6-interacting protein 1 isoform X3 [Agrilus planipennis]